MKGGREKRRNTLKEALKRQPCKPSSLYSLPWLLIQTSFSKISMKWGMMVHSFNPNNKETEAVELQVKANLGYIVRPYL